jgi:putative DNA methylase
MTTTTNTTRALPKRLIEVDLPIRKISEHARREKSIRHGHISTLHIWWARRPLAACRAVTLAALLPDPADPNCPQEFLRDAAQQLRTLRDRMGGAPRDWQNPEELREGLLEFIGDFANWDASRQPEFVKASRALTASAHRALGGVHADRPLVLDPFAGGGAIPVEALRCGADVFASDLNPIPVLLNTVVLSLVPRFGTRLADAIREHGAALQKRADDALAEYYPRDADGGSPLAFIWARTVRCEGPDCGCTIPLLRSMWLAKKGQKSVALRLRVNREARAVDFEVLEGAKVDPKEAAKGTVARGAATCPVCGFTMKVDRVRAQLRERHGGAADARMIVVVVAKAGVQGRRYRVPTERDLKANARAAEAASELRRERGWNGLRLIPDESTAHYHSFVNRGPIYGMTSWEDYFTPRQQLALGTMVREIASTETQIDPDFDRALRTCLALALSRQVDAGSSLCRWHTTRELHVATFGRQALPMVWDFSEVNVLSERTGGFLGAVEWVAKVVEENVGLPAGRAQVQLASATRHPLPDDSVDAVVTDPPYYYSVQYADLADFFYVWMRRSLGPSYPALFASPLIDKADEVIVQSPGHEFAKEGKNNAFYERQMSLAMSEARRVLSPNGIGVVVFAHKSTSGWEAQLQSMVNAGWVITASWPIDTEMAARVIAQGRAVLASSIHLVCRPREELDGRVREDHVGDWRAVLAELPMRIREWMQRLAREGVVGADAIFACLGPALEVFSRYSRVEKVSGEQVLLREYLEQVWASVSREALALMFSDADAAGLEEDARLTAMWLWTLAAPTGSAEGDDDADEGDADDEDQPSGSSSGGTYILEYDAARKIAQGLGVHIEQLSHVVEIGTSTARLLSVAERTGYLFGKTEGVPNAKKAAKKKQMTLFAELEEAAEAQGWGEVGAPRAGSTSLDRVHQAMLLFASGRSEALKRFLVEEGVGKQTQFWKLAQSFSALYPSGSEEKRWVDGVLARKRGLGFG